MEQKRRSQTSEAVAALGALFFVTAMTAGLQAEGKVGAMSITFRKDGDKRTKSENYKVVEEGNYVHWRNYGTSREMSKNGEKKMFEVINGYTIRRVPINDPETALMQRRQNTPALPTDQAQP